MSDILREVKLQNEGDTGDSTNTGGNAMFSRLGYGSTNLEKANADFVTLFERAEGMVHLEGLELLSTNYKSQNTFKQVNGYSNFLK